MGKNKLLTGFGFALCCMLLSALGVSAQAGHDMSDLTRNEDGGRTAGYTFCSAEVLHPSAPPDIYYSGVFSASERTTKRRAMRFFNSSSENTR